MRIARWLIGLVSLASYAVMASSTQAATITVTTTEDEVSANGACSLREAVRAANTDAAVDACPPGSGADTIVVPPGVYTLTITETARVEQMHSLLDLRTPIAITGAGQDATVIRGPGPCVPDLGWTSCRPSLRVVYVWPGAAVTIQGVTLRDNVFHEHIGGGAQGGGILNGGALTLRDSQVVSMSAGIGGGIYSTGTLTVERSTIASNSATFVMGPYLLGGGGGMYSAGGAVKIEWSAVIGNASTSNGGIYNAVGALMIDHSVIASNSGGGISNYGELIVSNSIIEKNRGDIGAGIAASGSTRLVRSIVRHNTAIGGSGKGGGWPGMCAGIRAFGSITITESAINGNAAHGVIDFMSGKYMPSTGGGLCAHNAFALIERSAIYSNSADSAGGVVVSGDGPDRLAPVRFVNVTISGNSAALASGGLRVEGGAAELGFVTLASNTAPIAANVHVATTTLSIPGGGRPVAPGSVHLGHAILAASGVDNCVVDTGDIASDGHNLSSDASCASLTAHGDITSTDPLLGPLQVNWPGMTPTHALLPGSPAIDAGDVLEPDSALTDQRGVARRWGGPRADIGAFEAFDRAILRSLYLPFGPR